MTIQAGKVSDLIKDNPVAKGCTISNQLFNDGEIVVTVFSLAANTSISAASYGSYHLLTVEKGKLSILLADQQQELKSGESLLTPKDIPIKVAASADTIYTEISLAKDAVISPLIRPGKAVKLPRLVPYQDGRVVNCDLVTSRSFKLALMSFDGGTGLAEHSAPGDALVFALDGNGIVNYKGEDKGLQTGKVLKMVKGARHSVQADGLYKMALLVMTPSATAKEGEQDGK